MLYVVRRIICNMYYYLYIGSYNKRSNLIYFIQIKIKRTNIHTVYRYKSGHSGTTLNKHKTYIEYNAKFIFYSFYSFFDVIDFCNKNVHINTTIIII